MSKQEEIIDLRARGHTITQIAKVLGIDRKTVRRHLSRDDFSPVFPVKEKRTSKLDPYKEIIDSWLEEDKLVFHKQHHTAARIHERLRDEYGLVCGITIVQQYVRQKRLSEQKRSSLDLQWSEGYAQIDFGDADVWLSGTLTRGHLFAASFPYSNMGFPQFFLGESAECVCQGLTDVFNYIGGVPHTLIFDNATGVGRRICQTIIETELFSRFRMHYGFALRFCNPEAGNEKGNVERKVSYLRNKLFVPVPAFDDIEMFNRELLGRLGAQEAKIHYQKEVAQGALFEKDFAALRSLPSKPFNVCRYEEHTSNGYGHVVLDGCHTYSTHPTNVCRKTICAIRAATVEFISDTGEILATHRRAFGKKKTASIDPASQLQLLARRPGGWSNSRVRSDIPPAVVAHLDSLERPELKRDLRLLYEASARSGLKATLAALEVLAADRDRPPDFFDVGVLAGRIAGYGLDTAPVPGADLDCYDRYFLKGEAYACN